MYAKKLSRIEFQDHEREHLVTLAETKNLGQGLITIGGGATCFVLTAVNTGVS
jgi:hypothetical protein